MRLWKVDCGACSISWTTPPKGTQMEPTVKTLFVVVDVPKDKGAIRVFEKGTDKHIGTVGTENAGHMVIIPWDDNWWFRVSGSLSVGYIEQQGHSQ